MVGIARKKQTVATRMQSHRQSERQECVYAGRKTRMGEWRRRRRRRSRRKRTKGVSRMPWQAVEWWWVDGAVRLWVALEQWEVVEDSIASLSASKNPGPVTQALRSGQ